MTAGRHLSGSGHGFALRHRLLSFLLWALVVIAAATAWSTGRGLLEISIITMVLLAFAVAAEVLSTPVMKASAVVLGLALGAAVLVVYTQAPLSPVPALVVVVAAVIYRMWQTLALVTLATAALGYFTLDLGSAVVLALGATAITVALTLAARLDAGHSRSATGPDRFHTSFEEAPIGMAVLKPSGQFIEANKAMTRILGYRRDQLTNANISGLIHVDDRGELGAAWEQMGNSSEHRASEWMRWVTSSGHPIWGRVSLSLVPRSDDQPALVILQLEDGGLAYEEQRRLEGLLEAKDDLVATLGEEIRQPLDMLIDLTDHAHIDTGDALPRIGAHAREIASIVDDIVWSARAETMPVTVVSQPVDAAELCRGVIAGMTDAEVRTSYEATEAWADPDLAGRIVENLVSNALRYGGPDVLLRTYSSGPDTVIEVSDDGAEIPEPERERIFSGDLRSGRRVTTPAAVGLNLTVGRRLARLMEGDLEYLRRQGRNVFELRLPTEQLTPTRPHRAAAH